MKKRVPITVICLLSLALIFVLTACSCSFSLKTKDKETEVQTEMPSLDVPAEEVPTVEIPSEEVPEVSEDLHLVSDDTHFVMEMAGVILSYEYEDDEVIGCKGYVNAGSEETASIVAQQYDTSTDATIESVTTQGIYVVLTFTEKAYDGLTVSALEDLYSEEQITE